MQKLLKLLETAGFSNRVLAQAICVAIIGTVAVLVMYPEFNSDRAPYVAVGLFLPALLVAAVVSRLLKGRDTE